MGRKVLVVDDQEMLRELCQEVLERDGFEVVTCDNGEAAIPVFRGRGPFNLVVTDVDLGPGKMDGIVLTRKLLEIDDGQPVIVMSGDNHAALQRAQQSGIPTLRKPFPIDLLSQLAREHARP